MSGLFADLVGQPQARTLLSAALEQNRLAPAYLLAGPDGVGRRLAAFKVPTTVTVVTESLPRNASGKILKRTLRDQVAG